MVEHEHQELALVEEGSQEDRDEDLIDQRMAMQKHSTIIPSSLEIDSFDVVADTTQTSNFSTEAPLD